MRFFLRLSVMLVLAWTAVGTAANKPADDYLKGLNALEKGRYKDAVKDFDRAVKGDDENATYYAARGVANVLAENFKAAVSDLSRSLRLRPNHRETRLWLGAAYRMGGNPAEGAKHFTHGGDVPIAYASLVYNDMAMDYWRSKKRDKFARCAATFVKRAKAGQGGAGSPDLSLPLFSAALKKMDKGEYAKALADLESILRSKPGQPDVLLQWCWCKIHLGDSERARRTLTWLLIRKTDNAEAYLARSLALARLGRLKGSLLDLKAADALDEDATDTFKAKYRNELARLIKDQPRESAAKLARDLMDAARKGDSPAKLLALAVKVRKASNNERIEADEAYQRDLAAAEAIARKLKNNLAAQMKVAELMYHRGKAYWTRPEPRGHGQSFPLQSTAEEAAERKRAEAICDRVLKVDDEHPTALKIKAMIRRDAKDTANVRLCVSKLLMADDDDPEVAVLAYDLAAGNAAILRAKAYKLLHPEFGDPSEFDVKDAQKLEASAKTLITSGLKHLEKCALAKKDTVTGALCLAKYYRLTGDSKKRLEWIEKAVKIDPKNVQALQCLMMAQDSSKMPEAWGTYTRWLNLVQTTAHPALIRVWSAVKATKYTSADKLLDEAVKLDPIDGRVSAYKGMVALGREKYDEAIACFKVTVALEEARAKELGTTFGTGGKDVRYAGEFGLIIRVRLILGAMLLNKKKTADALALFEANVALADRVAKDRVTDHLFSSLLPDPTAPADEIPVAWSFAEGIAWSRLWLGRALIISGQTVKGVKELEAVVELARTTRFFSRAGNHEPFRTLDEPKAWAALDLARIYLMARNLPMANKWLGQAGLWNKKVEAERKALQKIYQDMLNKRR